MRPPRARLALFALAAGLPFCVWQRTLVTRPAVRVAVRTAAGAPLANADVVVFWWSYPYRQLREAHRARTDAAGRAAFTELARSERIAPLCMHGVAEHHYTLCVAAPGYARQQRALEARPAGEVDVALAQGAAADDCATFERLAPLP